MALDLPDAAKRDIKVFLSHLAILDGVLEESRLHEPDVTAGKLFDIIAKKTNVSQGIIRTIFQVLENFEILKDSVRSSSAIFSEISAHLDGDTKSTWDQSEHLITSAISSYSHDNPVALSIKAHKLAFNFERIGTDFDIITDARPVFNSSGDEMVECVITHTLVVNSTVNRSNQRVYFALDRSDLLSLRSACDRAILKAKTLNKALLTGGVSSRGLNDNGL